MYLQPFISVSTEQQNSLDEALKVLKEILHDRKQEPGMRHFVSDVLIRPHILHPRHPNLKRVSQTLLQLCYGGHLTRDQERSLYFTYLKSVLRRYTLIITHPQPSEHCSVFHGHFAGKSCQLKCAVDVLHQSEVLYSKTGSVDLTSVQCVRNEIQTLQDLGQCPYITNLFAYRKSNHLPIFSICELPGKNNLFKFLSEERLMKGIALSNSEMIHFVKDAFSAVDYCHSKHIVVRKIIPSSFCVYEIKGELHLKLMDLEHCRSYEGTTILYYSN